MSVSEQQVRDSELKVIQNSQDQYDSFPSSFSKVLSMLSELGGVTRNKESDEAIGAYHALSQLRDDLDDIFQALDLPFEEKTLVMEKLYFPFISKIGTKIRECIARM